MKARLFGLLLMAVSVGLIYVNWRQLWNEGTYSTKLATFGPVVGVGGLYLLLFARAGKPTSTGEKVAVIVVLIIGMAAGLVNWYLMDPGFFGR